MSVLFISKQNKKRKITQSKRSVWKSWFYGALALLAAIISLNPTSVQASDNYFLGFTYDEDGTGISISVSKSNVNNGVTNHTEVEKSGNFLYSKIDGKIFTLNEDGSSLADAPVPSTFDEMKTHFPEDRKDYSSDDKYTLPFSFPGRHVGSGAGDRKSQRQGDANDQQQANWVGQQLTSGFNQLLAIAVNAQKSSHVDVKINNIHNYSADIANAAIGNGETSFGSDKNRVTMKFSNISDAEYEKVATGKYINKNFFRKVSVTGENIGNINNMIVPVAVNKGYDFNNKEERLYPIINGTEYGKPKYAGQDVHHISWQHMVLQAGHNAAARQVLTTNQANLSNPGRVEKTVSDMFSGIADSLKSWLGLQPITHVVFNQGVHDSTSVLGTMPYSLGKVADMVYMLVLVLALIIMLGSFVSILIKSNLSVINPQMRVDMKDSLMNIIGASFLLVAFQPIWGSLMVMNYELVKYFFGISNNISELGLGLTTGSGGIGLSAAVLSIAFLILEIWFNFYYIVRALTIMVLYMFAPLAIISISYGGRYKQIFENWLKEIIGALFTQSIHAAILGAVFAGLNRGLGGSLIWQFVILLSIIPLSDMLRKTVFNLGGDSIGSIAERAEKGFLTAGAISGGMAIKGLSTVGGAAVGGVANIGRSGGGSISGGGGGGGGGGKGSGISKLGDSVSDGSGASKGNAGVNYQNSSMTERGKAQIKQTGANLKAAGKELVSGYDPDDKLRSGVGVATKAAGKGVVGAARSLDSGVGKKALDIGSDAMGAVMTTGSMIGDVATDGGSSQAMLAGQRFLGNKGNNYGGGSGGFGGESDFGGSLLEQKEDTQYLDMLENNNLTGDEGELTNRNVGDGTQIMTSSREHMSRKQHGSNYQVTSPNSQHPRGATTYDTAYNAPHLTPALERASELSGKVSRGDALSDEESRQMDTLKTNTGISSVTKTDDGKYRMTFDHEALGWQSAAMDGKHYMAHADAHVDKRLPNIHNTQDSRTQNLANWNADASSREASTSTAETGT